MEILRKQLVNSLKGGQAFVPIEKAINNISRAARNKRPDENLHSIWEELEHMRIAQEDILQYMINPEWQSPEWPEEYWPRPVTDLSDEKWNKTFNGFVKDFKNTIELVNDPKIDPLAIIPHTTAHTYLREFCIVIEHNAYHIGKIIDIRKVLNNW
jgi:uncharacterized damage-inducible protein DinB